MLTFGKYSVVPALAGTQKPCTSTFCRTYPALDGLHSDGSRNDVRCQHYPRIYRQANVYRPLRIRDTM